MSTSHPIFERVAARWRARLLWGLSGLALGLSVLLLVVLTRYLEWNASTSGVVAAILGLALFALGGLLIRRWYSEPRII
ncbi:MAG TPA: hypothetical protein VLT17_12200, partial [Gemmatimonadales bacterium]|nr:hypothetical protein [Gemmatimonadales bacterium]